jgi:hypothetical protein
MVTDDELRADAAALAEGERTMRMPRRVVDGLLPPPASALGLALGPLTMEGWLRLIDVESMYLDSVPPASLLAEVRQFCFAVEVLSGRTAPEVAAAFQRTTEVEILSSMLTVSARINEAEAPILAMQPPPRPANTPAPRQRPSRDGGLGLWTLLYVTLVQDLGMSRADARACPVSEAHLLTAASRFREGWDVKGYNFREQEILGEAASDE